MNERWIVGLLVAPLLGLLVSLASCGDRALDETSVDESAAADEQAEAPVRAPTADEQVLLRELTALRDQGQTPRGIERAQAFLADHSDAFLVHYALGVLYGASDRHAEALTAFDAALAVEPRHVGSLRGRAISLHRLGRLDEALATLDEASRIAPADRDVQVDLGRLLGEAGELDRAEELLRAAAESGHPEAWPELGTVLRRAGRLDEAAAAFRRRLEIDAYDATAMLNLGQILLAQGETEAGEALLEKHSEVAALRDQLDLYRRSAMLDGATAENFLRLGELQLRFGRAGEAERSFARALELDAGSLRAALGLATLRLGAGDLDGASRWAVHALLHSPNDPKPHFVLGLVRLRRGQNAEAEAAFEASRAQGAWDAATWRHAGAAWRAAGEEEKAAAAFAAADAESLGSVD